METHRRYEALTDKIAPFALIVHSLVNYHNHMGIIADNVTDVQFLRRYHLGLLLERQSACIAHYLLEIIPVLLLTVIRQSRRYLKGMVGKDQHSPALAPAVIIALVAIGKQKRYPVKLTRLVEIVAVQADNTVCALLIALIAEAYIEYSGNIGVIYGSAVKYRQLCIIGQQRILSKIFTEAAILNRYTAEALRRKYTCFKCRSLRLYALYVKKSVCRLYGQLCGFPFDELIPVSSASVINNC